MKFKVGDRVKLIKHPSGNTTNGFREGNTYKITSISENGYYKIRIENENGVGGFVNEKHIAATQITKYNLQNGDIVVYRNGQTRMVMCNKLMNEDGIATNYLTKYEEDLRYKADSQKDIVKVERPVEYETVFERKEEILDEIEKKYLANVIRPFKDKIIGIKKCGSTSPTKTYIRIVVRNESDITFPDFETNTMYQRMEVGKKYTLEELGL